MPAPSSITVPITAEQIIQASVRIKATGLDADEGKIGVTDDGLVIELGSEANQAAPGEDTADAIAELVTDLDTKADTVALTTHTSDTNNPHGVSKSQVGLGNVDNTSDASKPVSTAAATALGTKADLVGGKVPSSQIPALGISEFLGAVASQVAMLALVGERGDWCNRTDEGKTYILNGDDGSILGNWTPTLTPAAPVSSVNGHAGVVVLDKTDIGLANVDNTSDANKPVSTAQQTALDAKASAASLATHIADATNPHGVTKTQVGLANANNTSDVDKPVSTAQQAAVDTKQNTITGTGNRGIGLNAAGAIVLGIPGPVLHNPSGVSAFGASPGAGNIDLYTVPAGKRLVVTSIQGYNPTGGSITAYLAAKIGGTYYRTIADANVVASTQYQPSTALLPILEAGDSMVLNASATGLNWWLFGYTMDDTSPVKSPRIIAVVNGDNTIYTAPAGYMATGWSPSTLTPSGNIQLCRAQASGGAITYTPYSVPSGQAVGASTRLAVAASLADKGQTQTVSPSITAGGALVINSTSANAAQILWATIAELANP